MTFVTGLLVLLHLVGAAIIVGTWIYTMKRPTVSPGQFHASLLSLITGLLLVGIHEMGEDPVNHAKVAVKLLIALAVAIAAFVGQRRTKRGQPVSTGLAHAVGGSALINMAVATLW
ncbi:hypothetical protein AS188_09115 [Kocuria flava]|uniref:Integral membrane protein n=1 Tax=Kocuria flava TaxID=446860 RepID=A0A0U3HFE6_9MICC|nr:hypothetical protein [Kocuria flava]ALU39881.1 hypothetical protein AS188_09115 [Kocuria flava]GEO93759.1 hypothetical protein KFL01_30650 [Kocuria flava]